MPTREKLNRMYELMERAFGPQHWWPGESAFEMMVGAVLTQNTNWRNVEKAVDNLKAEGLMSPEKLHALPVARLAELIRPAGYFNIKAKRLRNLIRWFMEEFRGDVASMQRCSVSDLRERLLSVSGVGRETCDSIILYALHKPTFVVDAYTYRILLRHGIIDESADYDEIKETFESNLSSDAKLFNEFHALLVRVGKLYCKKTALCEKCPLDALFADKSERPGEAVD
jgi:endonuclease-3 related protein